MYALLRDMGDRLGVRQRRAVRRHRQTRLKQRHMRYYEFQWRGSENDLRAHAVVVAQTREIYTSLFTINWLVTVSNIHSLISLPKITGIGQLLLKFSLVVWWCTF